MRKKNIEESVESEKKYGKEVTLLGAHYGIPRLGDDPGSKASSAGSRGTL